MTDDMTRLSFRLTAKLLRDMMVIAAQHNIFSYTTVIVQAIKLWTVVMHNKEKLLCEVKAIREVETWETFYKTDPAYVAGLLTSMADVLEDKSK